MLSLLTKFFTNAAVERFVIDQVFAIVNASFKNPATQAKYRADFEKLHSALSDALGK